MDMRAIESFQLGLLEAVDHSCEGPPILAL